MFFIDTIRQGFCIKNLSDGNLDWPEGSYCIYKKGECPPRMKKGDIFWDDEDHGNKNSSKYTHNVKYLKHFLLSH